MSSEILTQDNATGEDARHTDSATEEKDKVEVDWSESESFQIWLRLARGEGTSS